MNVFVVMQWKPKKQAKRAELCGVFLSRTEAEAACRDWSYWIYPDVVVGEQAPDESVDVGSYSPKEMSWSEFEKHWPIKAFFINALYHVRRPFKRLFR